MHEGKNPANVVVGVESTFSLFSTTTHFLLKGWSIFFNLYLPLVLVHSQTLFCPSFSVLVLFVARVWVYPLVRALCLHIHCLEKEPSIFVLWHGELRCVSVWGVLSKLIGVPFSRVSCCWVKFFFSAFFFRLILIEKGRRKIVFCWECGLFGLGLIFFSVVSLYHFYFWNCSFSFKNYFS